MVGVEQCEGLGPQRIPYGMSASTGMSKDKEPLEIIRNNYRKNDRGSDYVMKERKNRGLLKAVFSQFALDRFAMDP